MTLTTGQKLWLVPARGFGEPQEVEVGKIGRKWAGLIPAYAGRVDMETLGLDSSSFPGRCYGSREEWEEQSALGKAWIALHRELPYRPDKNVTIEDIAKARELLRMPLYSPESSK